MIAPRTKEMAAITQFETERAKISCLFKHNGKAKLLSLQKDAVHGSCEGVSASADATFSCSAFNSCNTVPDGSILMFYARSKTHYLRRLSSQ